MFHRLRLLPTVMLCAGLLLGLKVAHLVGGLEDFAAVSPAQAGDPGVGDPGPGGSAKGGKKSASAEGDGGAVSTKRPAQQEPGPADPQMSAAETAVLGSLSQRRDELDKRAKDLDMREQLLVAAQKRVEDRVTELKALEASIKSRIADNDKANEERLASVVKMYETMKPKDAARIFERLDMGVLVDVTKRMEPRKLAAILAVMDPVTAQELTVELATGDKLTDNPDDAPADNAPAAAPAPAPGTLPAPQTGLPAGPAKGAVGKQA